MEIIFYWISDPQWPIEWIRGYADRDWKGICIIVEINKKWLKYDYQIAIVYLYAKKIKDLQELENYYILPPTS